MKKTVLASALALVATGMIAPAAVAGEKETKGGYSYFRGGFEHVTYDEKHPGISSSVSVMSPVVNTGGLYYVNDTFDFSLEALATFSPGDAQEDWYDANGLMQTNKYQYLRASTNALLHYKMTPEWRLVGGPAFSYQTHKRYGKKSFQALPEGQHEFFTSTWEETSTDIFLDMGVMYDTGTLHNESPWHYKFSAILGVPVWSYTTNTAPGLEEQTFYDTGYRGALEAAVAYRVYPGVSIGGFVTATYENRKESDGVIVTIDDKRYHAVVPEGDTMHYSAGVQLLWSF
ncbi:hypothetical protein A1OO_06540 [Enterovibrio norvegicus FF-33]|uniref:hypothetical protein n=1 Tax=Enterovibrio norvegicus TaxID=188144 RepID=UPI000319378C|nr:hypothetical protein [Enterovibrio norvegicus]OEE68695.1 hypothetical protein A1OO_06540 [Enterovibrio norvegicus FF-33]